MRKKYFAKRVCTSQDIHYHNISGFFNSALTIHLLPGKIHELQITPGRNSNTSRQ